MASVAEWVEGARLRTLPAAVAPVLAGTSVAVFFRGADWLIALLCLLVALGLQVGVNYANDYSDGIKGTDAVRVGPQRLVASGAATPKQVLAAALLSFALAAVFGLVAVALTGMWWLLLVGAAAIAAAWFYTGGSNPYGYRGLGEVYVFIFFGLVAVCGTTLLQLGHIPWASLVAAIGTGALACAILVANNLRDIATDRLSGKQTLSARLGDAGSRRFFVVLVAVAAVSVPVFATLTTWWALLGWLGMLVILPGLKALLAGALGLRLVQVLKVTGIAEVGLGLGWLIGCFIGLS